MAEQEEQREHSIIGDPDEEPHIQN